MGMKRSCKSYKRVWSPFYRKRVVRCDDFVVHRGRKRKSKRRRKGGYRKGHRPANKGRTCKKYQTVWSPFFRKKVVRCAPGGYGGSKKKRRNGNGSGATVFRAPQNIPGAAYIPGYRRTVFEPKQGMFPWG